MAKDKNIQTMIGADASVEGHLTLEGGVVIYGKVFGNVVTKGPVRVAQGGSVHGEIRSSEAHIGGLVEGNVIVEGRAVLGSDGVLRGDLVYESLIIEEGAQFEGRCGIIRDEEPAPIEPAFETQESPSDSE